MRASWIVALAALTLLSPAVAQAQGDYFEEKITSNDDGSAWFASWAYGNTWSGPLPMAMRSEEGAGQHLEKRVLELCRREGYEGFRYATFSDVNNDSTLKEAWEYFGGAEKQSTFGRKIALKIVLFRDELDAGFGSCWTDRQRKAEEKRMKLEAKRKERLERMEEKLKEKQGKGDAIFCLGTMKDIESGRDYALDGVG